jgi:hypothetical protein
VYHKTKCITLFYLLSPVTYSTNHCRIFYRILSGYNREIWYILEYSRILVKPYRFLYPLITSLTVSVNYPTKFIFVFRKPSVGRSVRNNLFRFHPYSLCYFYNKYIPLTYYLLIVEPTITCKTHFTMKKK